MILVIGTDGQRIDLVTVSIDVPSHVLTTKTGVHLCILRNIEIGIRSNFLAIFAQLNRAIVV